MRPPEVGSRPLRALALRFSVTRSNAYFLTAAGSAPFVGLATVASTHSEAKNLLRAEVAETVRTVDEVDEEVRYLVQALGN